MIEKRRKPGQPLWRCYIVIGLGPADPLLKRRHIQQCCLPARPAARRLPLEYVKSDVFQRQYLIKYYNCDHMLYY